MVALRTRDPAHLDSMFEALKATARHDKIYAGVNEDVPVHKDGHSIILWQRGMERPIIYKDRAPIWETEFKMPSMRSDSEIYAIMHVRQDWFNALLKSIQLPIHIITPKLYIIKEDTDSSQNGYGAGGPHNYGISTNYVSDPDVLSKSFRILLSKVDKYAVTNGSLFTGPKGAPKLDFGYNCMVLEVSNDKEKADIHYLNTFLIFKNGKSEKEYRSKILYYQLYRADLSDGTKIVASSSVMDNASIKGRKRVPFGRRLRL
jgi:hypothetical protein